MPPNAEDPIVSSLRQRMDPELVEGLDGFLAATGPRGLAGIADPVERRRTFLGLMEAGAGEPDPRVATEDLRRPRPTGSAAGAGAHLSPGRARRPPPRAPLHPRRRHGDRRDRERGRDRPRPLPRPGLRGRLGRLPVGAGEPPPGAGRGLLRGALVDGRRGGPTRHRRRPDRRSTAAAPAAASRRARRCSRATAAAPRSPSRCCSTRCSTTAATPPPATRSKTSACSTAGPAGRASRRCSASAAGPTRSTTTPPPTRCPDLAGLPPAWIDVGELDALRDESIDYAQRLMQAGVPAEIHVTAGCFHASEVFVPDAASSRRIVAARVEALRRAFS